MKKKIKMSLSHIAMPGLVPTCWSDCCSLLTQRLGGRHGEARAQVPELDTEEAPAQTRQSETANKDLSLPLSPSALSSLINKRQNLIVHFNGLTLTHVKVDVFLGHFCTADTETSWELAQGETGNWSQLVCT